MSLRSTGSARAPELVACTIVARNYLPHARVLCDSVRRVHPDAQLFVLLFDDWARVHHEPHEGFTLLHLDDLGLDADTVHAMAAIYGVYELATALKPSLLRHLLARFGGEVLYLDPDIEVFAPLGGLADLARAHEIVLTPHVLEPMPRDGCALDEQAILSSGIFNLGFIAVSEAAGPFLRFWSERLRQDAIVAPARGYFTDQRWVDFVPALFPHHVLRDRTANVAYWNAFQRPLREVGDTYWVGDEPLKFFHFSGFDPATPHMLSKHEGERPRVLLSESPALARICRDHAQRLLAHDADGASRHPYGLAALPNGLPLDPFLRRYYRRCWQEADRGGPPPPQRIFSVEGAAAFAAWLREAVAGTRAQPISRHLFAYRQERPDLQVAFPDLSMDAHAGGLRAWAKQDAGYQSTLHPVLEGSEPAVLPEEPARSFRKVAAARLLPGVNVAGWLNAPHGVGHAARLLLSGVEHLGVPFSTLSWEADSYTSARIGFEERGPRDFPFDMNIVCINADRTPAFAKEVGPDFFRGRHTAGLWFWELEELPASMLAAQEHLDELWVASEFGREALARVSDKPVFKVPLPITTPSAPTHLTRADLELPGGFLFLYYFDFASIAGRKNPDAAITAFQRAFSPRDDVSLVIKTVNGRNHVRELERLRARAASHPGIRIVDRQLPPARVRAMTSLCDCYVSLHRSEGFGLTIAEAMAAAKPVIATAYSGNLDFTTADNALLVPWTRVRVGEGNAPYAPTATWAEPDVDAAAAMMRKVFEQPELARALGVRARADIERNHGLAQTAEFLRQRLEAVRAASALARRRREHSVSVAGAPAALERNPR